MIGGGALGRMLKEWFAWEEIPSVYFGGGSQVVHRKA